MVQELAVASDSGVRRSAGGVSDICGSFDDANESGDAPAELAQKITDSLAALESEGIAVWVGDGDQARWRAADPSRKRLPQGGLQGLVDDFLAEHVGREFGPHVIGTTLRRSSGAVANALVRLTERGVAVQVFGRELATVAGDRSGFQVRWGTRRAMSYSTSGEIEYACELTKQLLAAVDLVDSATVRSDLHEVTRTLSRGLNHPAVRALSPALTSTCCSIHARRAGSRGLKPQP